MTKAHMFMLTAAAALCLGTSTAQAEGDDCSQRFSQQREYRSLPCPPTMPQYVDGDYKPAHKYHAKAGQGQIEWQTQTIKKHVHLTQGQLQQVQSGLRDAGHDVKVDGVWGPQTVEALKNYQQQKSLKVTGTLNSETLAALDVYHEPASMQ